MLQLTNKEPPATIDLHPVTSDLLSSTLTHRQSSLDERVRKMDAYISSLQGNIEDMVNQIKVLKKSCFRLDQANVFLTKVILVYCYCV